MWVLDFETVDGSLPMAPIYHDNLNEILSELIALCGKKNIEKTTVTHHGEFRSYSETAYMADTEEGTFYLYREPNF